MTGSQKNSPTENEAEQLSKTIVNQVVPISQDMIAKLNAPLSPEAISQHPTKSYLSTIKAIYVVERFNEVFGIGGWYINNAFVEKVKVPTKNGEVDNVVIKATFHAPKYGIVIPDIFGGNDNPDLGDAYKGACTDALTKIGSYLGVGMDVYKGLGDKKNPKMPSKPTQGTNNAVTPNSDEWGGAPKSVRPASTKQVGFIKGLLEQKGIDRKDEKIASKLEKLTSEEASAWIDKLNKMEDKEVIPTIDVNADIEIGKDTPL